jgi:hypothetical protein
MVRGSTPLHKRIPTATATDRTAPQRLQKDEKMPDCFDAETSDWRAQLLRGNG